MYSCDFRFGIPYDSSYANLDNSKVSFPQAQGKFVDRYGMSLAHISHSVKKAG